VCCNGSCSPIKLTHFIVGISRAHRVVQRGLETLKLGRNGCGVILQTTSFFFAFFNLLAKPVPHVFQLLQRLYKFNIVCL
jgi:hypothetical protein